MELESCDNCGRKIGKLESAMSFGNNTVCAECHARLSKPNIATPKNDAPTPPPRVAVQNDKPVVTTEKTGKKWKRMQLNSAALIIFGTIFFCAGASDRAHSEMAVIALVCIVLGIGMGIYGTIGAWWHHG